jgi:hypothetical protein
MKLFFGVFGGAARVAIPVLFGINLCNAQSNLLENRFNKAERLFKLDNWVEARDLYAACDAQRSGQSHEQQI